MTKANSYSVCALCGVPLIGRSRSKEHIIPNAIGGRLKTAGFICDECNNTKGKSWDAALAKQLNWFSLSFGISRERGEPPGQLVNTVDGRQYMLASNGSFYPKSSYSEELVDGNKKIHMVAASIQEATKRLKGVAKKHTSFDLEQALSELKMQTVYLESPLEVELSLGGMECGRSLVKTALAYASYCGVKIRDFGRALDFLLNNEAEPPYGHAYLSDLVINRDRTTMFHCVAVKSDLEKKRLWSYIEYFGMFRVLVLINDDYEGLMVDSTHAINPVTGRGVDVAVDNGISDADFCKIIDGYGHDPAVHKAAADLVMPLVIERSKKRTFEGVVSEGFAHAALSLGIAEGENIPPERAKEFTALMMEKITPYLTYLVRNGRRGD
jgi:hypothetical protein